MTLRSQSELHALFGPITPARLRDFVDSVLLCVPTLFGTGVDGPLVVGAGQTMTLSRTSQHTLVLLGDNATLDLDGQILMSQTPIVMSSSSVITTRAGTVGANGTAVAGGAAISSYAARPMQPWHFNRSGGLNGAGTAGQSISYDSTAGAPSGVAGGASSSGQAGGAGGVASASTLISGLSQMPWLISNPLFWGIGTPFANAIPGAASSGGGGGAAGAGGGASGTQSYGVCIYAPDIIGGGTIRARGAAGGNGYTGSGVGGGGGGGGAGGVVVVVDKVGATQAYVVDNAGGAGGLGGGSGAQPGATGPAGPVIRRSL